MEWGAGTLVWAKLPSLPWWCGRIATDEDLATIADSKRTLKDSHRYVAFFGDQSVDKVLVKNLRQIDCAEYAAFATNKTALKKTFFTEAIGELKEELKEVGKELPLLDGTPSATEKLSETAPQKNDTKGIISSPSTAVDTSSTAAAATVKKRPADTTITAIMAAYHRNVAKKAKIAAKAKKLTAPTTITSQLTDGVQSQHSSTTGQQISPGVKKGDNTPVENGSKQDESDSCRSADTDNNTSSTHASQTNVFATKQTAGTSEVSDSDAHMQVNIQTDSQNNTDKQTDTHGGTNGGDSVSESDSDSDDEELRSSGLRAKDSTTDLRVVPSVVWAKMGRWPHWPAVLLDIRRDKQQKKFVVKFINYKPIGDDGRPILNNTAWRLNENRCVHFSFNDDKVQQQLKASRGGLYPKLVAYDDDLVEAARDAQQWLRNRAHGLLMNSSTSTAHTQPTPTQTQTNTHTRGANNTTVTTYANDDDIIASVSKSKVEQTSTQTNVSLTTVSADAAEITDEILSNGRRRRITTIHHQTPDNSSVSSVPMTTSQLTAEPNSDSDSDSDDGGDDCDAIDWDAIDEEERLHDEAAEQTLLTEYPELNQYRQGLKDDLAKIKPDIVALDTGAITTPRKTWYDKGFTKEQRDYLKKHTWGPYVTQADQDLIYSTVESWSVRKPLLHTDVTAGFFISNVLVVEAVLRLIAMKENITPEEAYDKCSKEEFTSRPLHFATDE